MKLKLVLLLIANATLKLFAQTPGSLDTTFGVNGKVVTSINGIDDRIFAVKVQPDNKIVVAGEVTSNNQRDFVIARYENNGTLDSAFGIGGYTITSIGDSSDAIRDLHLQTDGKIVVVGEAYVDSNYTLAMARYNSDGSIDSTFGINGIVTRSIGPLQNFSTSFGISSSGKIYAAVNSYLNTAVLKFDENGNTDSTFGNFGVSVLPSILNYFSTLELTNDNKIICGGATWNPDYVLCKIDTLGIVDSSFGNNGVVVTDLGYDAEQIEDIEILPDGRIVVGGSVANIFDNWDYVIAMYNNDGSIDSTFGVNGRIITSFTNGRDILQQIDVQTDGKIVAAGYCGNIDFGMIRYNANGTLDSSFGNNGKVVTDYNFDYDLAFTLDIQPDNKILLAGETWDNGIWKFALARYMSGLNVGLIDFSDEKLPRLAYPNPVSDYAYINYTLTTDENLSMKLYDANGHEIKSFMENVKRQKGDQKEYLYFDNAIQAGVYFLSISNGKSVQAIKIVKN